MKSRGNMLTISDVSIFKRKRSSEKRTATYTCQLRNPHTGKFSGGRMVSVLELAKQLNIEYDQINKNDARWIVQEAISKGILKNDINTSKDSALTSLVSYVEKICSYEISPWVKYEADRKKDKLSKKYVDNLLRSFQIHAKPLINSKKTLGNFSRADAQNLQKKMADNNVSTDNLNSAIKAIRTAYNYALMQDIVEYNPFIYIKPYIPVRKKKHILSRKETTSLLRVMQYHADESITKHAVYLAVKLSIFSGMREGEIRALTISKIENVLNDSGSTTDYYKIYISTSWDDATKAIKTTKGKYNRTSVIHKALAEELFSFAKKTGRNKSLLFKASKNSMNKRIDSIDTPMTKSIFQKYLYEGLCEIGIDEEARKERGITFHSLRHFYDSEAKASVHKMELYAQEIRKAVGHKSKSVDELIYTHDTPTSLIALGVISEHILDLS